MIIPEKLLSKWRTLNSPGDPKKMAEKMGEESYPELFSRALKIGKCNDAVFKTMADFYEEKAKLIKEYL